MVTVGSVRPAPQDAVSAWVGCGRATYRWVKAAQIEGLLFTAAGTFGGILVMNHDPLGLAPVIAAGFVVVLAVSAMLLAGRAIDREHREIAVLKPDVQRRLDSCWGLAPGSSYRHEQAARTTVRMRSEELGAGATGIVWFRLDDAIDSFWPRWEGLMAQLEGGDRARIVSTPFFAHGVNFGDQVRTSPSASGDRVAEDVVIRGGQSQLRVHYPTPSAARRFGSLLAAMPEGVAFEQAGQCVFVLTFPGSMAPRVHGELDRNRLIVTSAAMDHTSTVRSAQ